jgi:dihydrofolate synthase/folylpolyglutamate synthase
LFCTIPYHIISYRHFAENKVDYVILEAGIGGRFDSTNFIDSPEACVITSVSLDHQDMLGHTIGEIAWQKAGIVKTGGQVFVAASLHPDALEVVQKECVLKEATLHTVSVDL